MKKYIKPTLSVIDYEQEIPFLRASTVKIPIDYDEDVDDSDK